MPSTRPDSVLDLQQDVTALTSQIRSDVLRRLVAHWRRICRGRRMPARADFDPLEVRFAVGYISLIAVHRDPLRFFFRLDGTKQVELFGIDCTQRYLDEVMPADHATMATASYCAVVERREPSYHQRKIPFRERLIDYEIMILPFSDDGDRVDLLMTGIVPDRPL